MLEKFLDKKTWLQLATLVLVITLCTTFLAWNHTKAIIEDDRLREFDAGVRDIEQVLERKIDIYKNTLYSLQGFFAASASVERDEWSPFVKTARIDLYPDIDYISFVQVVPDREKTNFTAAFINDKSIRPSGYPVFTIYPEGTRSEYAVIKYAEPESDSAVEAYGFDLYTDAARNDVLVKARDTGEPQISEKIFIIPDNLAGFIMSAPVYRNDLPHDTIEERRLAIEGFVQVVIKVDSLFNVAGGQSSYKDIVFDVYDNVLLYSSDSGKYGEDVVYSPGFSQTKALKIGKRTWTLKFVAAPSFGASYTRAALPLVVLIGGISLSVLLFLIFLSQGKSAEKRIMASETRYRRLFEAAQDGILILDAYSGKIIDANLFLKALLGYTKEEIIGKQLWKIGVFKDIAASKAEFMKLQAEGLIRYENLTLQSKDGQIINVEFVSNVYDVDNKKVIQCNIRDISVRKKAEEEIKARNKMLETMVKTQENTKKAMLNVLDDLETAKFEIETEKVKAEATLASIGDGVVATDSEARIAVINKSAEDLLHCKSAQVLGKKFFEVWKTEDNNGRSIPTAKLPIQLALSSAKVVSTKYCYVLKDKTKFPVALTVTPIIMGKKVEGAIEVFRDIAKEMEINKAKTEFVSLASHQLRTPLGIIKWYLESVREQSYFKDAPKKAFSYLQEIYKNNERIIILVRDLLSVSRIDQGQVKDNPESIDLAPFVKYIVREMNIIAAKKNIRINLENKVSDLPKLWIDKVRLREVIENLIVNAIEYNISSGEVRVVLDKKTDNTLLISVIDSGIRISSEDQKNLFTKFFRTEKGSTFNTEGSGLGLYVVKSYVGDWGGKVFVESEEGKGSTFTVTIPFVAGNKRRGVNKI